jgi:uncharacterized protein (TIGR03435 family)
LGDGAGDGATVQIDRVVGRFHTRIRQPDRRIGVCRADGENGRQQESPSKTHTYSATCFHYGRVEVRGASRSFEEHNPPKNRSFLVRIISLLLLTAIAALAQPAKPLAFDVASIRPGHSGRESIEFGPASLTMRNVRLSACIRWAYGVQDVQVSGPAWLNEVWFEIFAKSAGEVKVSELRQMLQTLLADRFKLAVHRDTKEMTVLVLTVSKSGHKLAPADGDGPPSFQIGKLNLTGKNTTLSQLLDFIANEVHIPVVDQTGLTGRYNYFFDIEPYYSEESRKATDSDGKPLDANAIIAVAMQKELGIKAESKKVPLEVIVVDHVEKTPIEN